MYCYTTNNYTEYCICDVVYYVNNIDYLHEIANVSQLRR